MAKTRSRDNTAPNLESLEQERRKLLLSGNNPERLKKVTETIDFLNWGIVPKNK